MKQAHRQHWRGPEALRSTRSRVRYIKASLWLLFLSPLSACGHVHPAGVALAPNPPAPAGYRASCSSLPLPFNGFITACAPAQSEQVAVVHAKS